MRNYISISLKPETAKLLTERGDKVKNLSALIDKLLYDFLADTEFQKKQAFANFNIAIAGLKQFGYTAELKHESGTQLKIKKGSNITNLELVK